MAFTTTIRAQGAGFTPTTLFDLLDDLLIDQSDQVSDVATTQTLSATSFTTLTSMTSTITVESNQKVLVAWDCSISANIAGDDFRFSIFENSTELTATARAYVPVTGILSTTANVDFCSQVYLIEAPATGSVTYTIKAKRNSGAGNLYINYRRMAVIAFRAS